MGLGLGRVGDAQLRVVRGALAHRLEPSEVDHYYYYCYYYYYYYYYYYSGPPP